MRCVDSSVHGHSARYKLFMPLKELLLADRLRGCRASEGSSGLRLQIYGTAQRRWSSDPRPQRPLEKKSELQTLSGVRKLGDQSDSEWKRNQARAYVTERLSEDVFMQPFLGCVSSVTHSKEPSG